ncbi:MAG: YceD family protein [bacterium]
MKIDLTELLQQPDGEINIEQVKQIDLEDDEVKLLKPVEITAQLLNTGLTVLLLGSAKTVVELECSRCLKKLELPLSIKIEEEYAKAQGSSARKKEIELKAADFVYPIEPDNSIDLREMLRQNILLAIPTKTLCREECQGIQKEEK